ncbi:transposase [Lewinella sp. W8]|uniref:transposase n=1 Tax=Lewinella sp. W8 TaxID=2528208 RepID=UPI001068C4B3|nr:transposase [Lewinella sp. W8]MTB51880.1 hypothetical protein [Lewinella sp. W8]
MRQFKNHDITRDPVHVIYRLENSIPRQNLIRLREAYQQNLLQLEIGDNSFQDQYSQPPMDKESRLQEEFQLRYDQELHTINQGPHLLANLEIKRIIIDDWIHFQSKGVLEIYAISVMSNHVHVLLASCNPWERIDFKKFMASRKRFTARKINQVLKRRGKLWARTSFDRTCRKNQFGTVFNYVINNPLKAGLTNDPISWKGNYINPNFL